MNLWERFLRIIYRTAAKPYLRKYNEKSLESVLQKSLLLLDESISNEIKSRVKQWVSVDGGFADRGGKSDLYYSLFGYFTAEALQMHEVFPKLKDFVKSKLDDPSLSGVNLRCAAILYAKQNGLDSTTEKLISRIKLEMGNSEKTDYSVFLDTLALYYLEDFRALLRLVKSSKFDFKGETPSTVIAAMAVLNGIGQKPTKDFEAKLMSYYRGKGGFAALRKSPIEDLLSTSVALYALNFIDADIKSIKPDCLSYVDGLYLNGGFCATEMDFDIDIEYTFYGLLALGALSE